jgi:hypothetical protein
MLYSGHRQLLLQQSELSMDNANSEDDSIWSIDKQMHYKHMLFGIDKIHNAVLQL